MDHQITYFISGVWAIGGTDRYLKPMWMCRWCG